MTLISEGEGKVQQFVNGLKFKDTKYIWFGLRDTRTSVICALTGYSASKSCEALSIAKKWEIYLPPDKRDEIQDIQGRCERKKIESIPGAPTGSTAEFDAIYAFVEKLEKQLEEIKRRR